MKAQHPDWKGARCVDGWDQNTKTNKGCTQRNWPSTLQSKQNFTYTTFELYIVYVSVCQLIHSSPLVCV